LLYSPLLRFVVNIFSTSAFACTIFSGVSAFRGSGSSGEGGGVSDGRRSQRFNVVSLLVFESFTSNFIMNEHKLTYC
jgi:hypothetical protein